MKGCAHVPMSRYVDCFHNIVASGGFMKYHFYQLLWEINKLGVSPSAIDDFDCIIPKSHQVDKSHSRIALSSIVASI
jgi:hypothetical protein